MVVPTKPPFSPARVAVEAPCMVNEPPDLSMEFVKSIAYELVPAGVPAEISISPADLNKT